MIYSIVNHKGGTGKTTTAVNLGSALAQLNKSVLLIDLDPQANLTFSFGLQNSTTTIVDCIEGNVAIEDAIVRSEEALDIVPGAVGLADVEINLINKKDRAYFIKEQLAELAYDYILIDCPPSLSVLTINALTASDRVIIPLQPEVLSVKGLELITETIEGIKETFNSEITIEGVLPVMVDFRKNLSRDVIEYIKDNAIAPVLNSSIRTNVKASEAPSYGQSVVAYAPKSNSAIDYVSLANEILTRQN